MTKRTIGTHHASRVACLLLFGVAVGCGGSSGDKTEFSGSVSDGTRSLRVAGGLDRVSVCALGNCALSNEAGIWSFDVEKGSFSSGPVLFELLGNGVSDQVVVDGIEEDSEEVMVDFVIAGSRVQSVNVDNEDFDDDVDDEIEEEFDEIDDEADDLADDIDDEADDLADDINDETDETIDDIEEDIED